MRSIPWSHCESPTYKHGPSCYVQSFYIVPVHYLEYNVDMLAKLMAYDMCYPVTSPPLDWLQKFNIAFPAGGKAISYHSTGRQWQEDGPHASLWSVSKVAPSSIVLWEVCWTWSEVRWSVEGRRVLWWQHGSGQVLIHHPLWQRSSTFYTILRVRSSKCLSCHAISDYFYYSFPSCFILAG